MNREEVSEALPILQAFAEGKVIEQNKLGTKECWLPIRSIDINLLFSAPEYFRVKSEPKYRPFKDEKECYEEMKEHRPFGCIRMIEGSSKSCILNSFDDTSIYVYGELYSYREALDLKFEFFDGTPFGVLEKD
jgi:hypothetical protein